MPDGSRRTRDQSAPGSSALSARASVKTLEMLWMEKGTSASPALNTSPAEVATAMPKRLNSRGDREMGDGLRELILLQSAAGGFARCRPGPGPAAVPRVRSSWAARELLMLAGPFLDVEQGHQCIAGIGKVQAGQPGCLADPVIDGVLVETSSWRRTLPRPGPPRNIRAGSRPVPRHRGAMRKGCGAGTSRTVKLSHCSLEEDVHFEVVHVATSRVRDRRRSPGGPR